VGDCVNSVLSQTYDNIEIICVDNNSTDNTLAILNSLQSRNPTKIQVTSQPIKGAPAARNKGLSLAKGEWIQFLDADDIILENKIASQINSAKPSSVEVIVSDYQRMNNSLTDTIAVKTLNEITKETVNYCISNIIITGNPLYKKEIFEKYGGWDESLKSAQDWELNLRLALNNVSFCYVEGIFLLSREVPDSISSNWKTVSIQASRVLLKHFDYLKSTFLTDKSKSKITNTHYESLRFCKDESLKEDIINSLKRTSYNYLKYLTFYKRVLIKALGLKHTIEIEKRIHPSVI